MRFCKEPQPAVHQPAAVLSVFLVLLLSVAFTFCFLAPLIPVFQLPLIPADGIAVSFQLLPHRKSLFGVSQYQAASYGLII